MGVLIKIIENAFKVIIVLCGMSMTLVILVGVFCRYVLLASLPWTEELPRFLMIWMAMLAGPVAFEYHVSFDAIVNRMRSHFWKFFVFAGTRLLIIGFLSVLVAKGLSLMKAFAFQASPTLGISYAIPYSSVPLAGILFLLKYLVELATGFKNMVNSG